MIDSPTFAPLYKLFRGDTRQIRNALEVFERITTQDLHRMDEAFAHHDWKALGRLAHKLRSGCHQIGEISAAEGLAAIERAVSTEAGAETLAGTYAAARHALDLVMIRVNGFLAPAAGGSN